MFSFGMAILQYSLPGLPPLVVPPGQFPLESGEQKQKPPPELLLQEEGQFFVEAEAIAVTPFLIPLSFRMEKMCLCIFLGSFFTLMENSLVFGAFLKSSAAIAVDVNPMVSASIINSILIVLSSP